MDESGSLPSSSWYFYSFHIVNTYQQDKRGLDLPPLVPCHVQFTRVRGLNEGVVPVTGSSQGTLPTRRVPLPRPVMGKGWSTP